MFYSTIVAVIIKLALWNMTFCAKISILLIVVGIIHGHGNKHRARYMSIFIRKFTIWLFICWTVTLLINDHEIVYLVLMVVSAVGWLETKFMFSKGRHAPNRGYYALLSAGPNRSAPQNASNIMGAGDKRA